MAERLESLKAGIIGGFSLLLAFSLTSLLNSYVLASSQVFASLRWDLFSIQAVVSVAITSFSGLLFGVTYRYIVRNDQNPQLKAGGVMAFGLVRGLGVVDTGINCNSSVLPLVVLAAESILWFALAASILDTAMQLGWVKEFK